LLNDWTIALKTTGAAREIEKKIFNFSKEYEGIKMAIRRGPKGNDPACNKFLDGYEFRATGKNANIVSAGSDFSILLSDSQKKSAEEKFIQEKITFFTKKGVSHEDALIKAKKVTKPASIYREKMTNQQGLLVIYLFDTHYVFNQEGAPKRPKIEYEKFNHFVKREDINTDIPLVGYAIGFPPIDEDIGGVFMKGKYELDQVLDEDEESLEKEMEEDLNFDN
jgi:hypothetical protein